MLSNLTILWLSIGVAIFLTIVSILAYCSLLGHFSNLLRHFSKELHLNGRQYSQIVFLVFIPSFITSLLVLYNMLLLMLFLLLLASMVLVTLEIFLRQVLKERGIERYIFRHSQGRNGVQVSYSEAKKASGDYPYAYLTEEYFASIQYGNMYEREIFQKNICQGVHYDQAFDYEAPGISVRNGLRTTTDQPIEFEKSLLFFGGSTTFGGREVPDDLTFSSFIQRKINSVQKNILVINHGQGGATAVDRVNWLMAETPINSGDIICFYIGANDCGWVISSYRGMTNQIHFQSPLLRLLRVGRLLKVVLFQWLYGELAFLHNKRCANKAVKDTIMALTTAKRWAELKGCAFLIVLQPHLYVSKTNLPYEVQLKPKFSDFLIGQLDIAYSQYEKFVRDCGFGVSATSIFDNLEQTVYLDWCHVNARGNEIIADYLFRVLFTRAI